ncbi:uncharacterized protein LOC108598131 [Drosophila busckii]|uniref:uncharacterized protein LOC108598131 n=1 Tax=Drosophila busckii TaxID=30019 RepID=UPI00083EB9FD|nr:uncharacterized protein LOC108598131 [Drosophila busckii]
MEKMGLACPLAFLAGRTQRIKTHLLDLNHDCFLEIFSYLPSKDKLNLARTHPMFRDVLVSSAKRRYARINMRMLKRLTDWEYFFEICGLAVGECVLRHGCYDDEITLPFLSLLHQCKNLRHMQLIFVHSDKKETAENSGNANILSLLQDMQLESLSLTDAKAVEVRQLQHFVTLQALHIDGIDVELSDRDLELIFQALQQLRRLSLRFTNQRSFPPLSNNCTQLEHLSLENFNADITDIGKFSKLKTLRCNWRFYGRLNNQLFRTLAYSIRSSLEQLHLTAVRPDQVGYVLMLKRLKAFSCNIYPSEAVLDLQQLQQLQCLSLKTQPIRSFNELLTIIKACNKLQHLKLGKNLLPNDMLLEQFLYLVNEHLQNHARAALVLTLDSNPNLLQNHLSASQAVLQMEKQPLLQVKGPTSVCQLCKPDRHNKTEVFLN